MFIKIAVQTLQPFTMVGLRFDRLAGFVGDPEMETPLFAA